MNVFLNLGLFVLIISVVVFVHELGHFIMAKRSGVTVHEFAIGMGPTLFSREKNGTKYALRAIPIGGFVSMEGENEESDSEGSFTRKSPLARLGILLAGIFNNFLLGLVLIFIFFCLNGVVTTKIDTPIAGLPAEAAGLAYGDRIEMINGRTVDGWEGVIREIAEDEDGSIDFTVRRGEDEISVRIQTVTDPADGRRIIGIRPLPVKEIGAILSQTISAFWGVFTGVFHLLKNVFRPEVVKDVVGPIGLYRVVGDVGSRGAVNLLFLTGFISINIGIVNLLPIPAFDGGRALMVFAEMVTGKRLNRRLENVLIMAGFVLILFLVVLTFYQDLVRLFGAGA